MLTKVLSLIFIGYGAVGLAIVLFSDWPETIAQLQYLLIYVVAPWFGAFALLKRSRIGLGLTLLVFSFISVRIANLASSFPIVAPVSMSITFGDFTKGTGGLIDFFAIMVTILIALSIRKINNEKINDSKPT